MSATSSRQKPKVRDVSHWERGWKQNLDAYMASRDPDDLMPMYIRPALPLRCNGHFVMPDDPFCEWKWYRKFLEYISDRWLADSGNILEIGCGFWAQSRMAQDALSRKSIFGLGLVPQRRGESQTRYPTGVPSSICSSRHLLPRSS